MADVQSAIDETGLHGMALIIVLDTNVQMSALMVAEGAAGRMLTAIQNGDLILVISGIFYMSLQTWFLAPA
jgi:predicted nucleic acid-binding protein